MSPLDVLRLVPGHHWAYLALVAAVGTAGVVFVHHERAIGAATAQAQLEHERAAVAAAGASAAAAAATESQRREARMLEIVNATQQLAVRVASDSAALARERGDLQLQLADYRARAIAVDPAAPNSCAAARAAVDLLADLFGRASDRAAQLARVADDRGVAGQACERAYDALTPP